MSFLVAGIGTDAGKTTASAFLATLLGADYWKPIECGESDTKRVEKWLGVERVHPPAYSFKAPLSPHHAARLENRTINPESIIPPKTERPLIIEGVGGIFTPLTSDLLAIDLFAAWDYPWIVVSRHYVGSINHTLLTLEALKRRNIVVAGIIFNGEPNPDSEKVILDIGGLPSLGRLK